MSLPVWIALLLCAITLTYALKDKSDNNTIQYRRVQNSEHTRFSLLRVSGQFWGFPSSSSLLCGWWLLLWFWLWLWFWSAMQVNFTKWRRLSTNPHPCLLATIVTGHEVLPFNVLTDINLNTDIVYLASHYKRHFCIQTSLKPISISEWLTSDSGGELTQVQEEVRTPRCTSASGSVATSGEHQGVAFCTPPPWLALFLWFQTTAQTIQCITALYTYPEVNFRNGSWFEIIAMFTTVVKLV